MRKLVLIVGLFFLSLGQVVNSVAGTVETGIYNDLDSEGFEEYEVDQVEQISDPLEGFNRAVFTFNDRVYFWVLKPVSVGYGKVVPEIVRQGVKNFFYNLNYPMRFVGAVTQLKAKKAAMETFRFLTNTVFGLGGLIDYSGVFSDFQVSEEDSGQALGFYGVGNGIYIVWPFLGPMSLRDTLGFSIDYFLQPVSYINPIYLSFGVRSYEVVNKTSFEIGDYEAIKKSSLDPYIAIRDAYLQYRASQISK